MEILKNTQQAAELSNPVAACWQDAVASATWQLWMGQHSSSLQGV